MVPQFFGREIEVTVSGELKVPASFSLGDHEYVISNILEVWHDYGFHPDKIRYEVMAAILDGAGPERAGRIYHVAHTKAAIFTGRPLKATEADFPAVPQEYYELQITRKER